MVQRQTSSYNHNNIQVPSSIRGKLQTKITKRENINTSSKQMDTTTQ